MIQRAQRPGYVMVFSLMMIAIIIVLITAVVDRSRVHVHYMKTIIDREKAKSLAWSGVQVAMSQLATMHQSKKEDAAARTEKEAADKKKKTDVQQEAKQFITTILPRLNRWQSFKLTKKNDGITGSIKICIGCEEGKININQLFDFQKKQFINEGAKQKDYKKIMQQFFAKIKEVVGGDKLFKTFEKFLKERENKLYDPTELLSIKEFKRFNKNIFYTPDDVASSDKKEVKQTIYLQDIFTLWSGTRELNPWLFSHSLKVLLGLKTDAKGIGTQEEKKLQEAMKQFKLPMTWPNSWDTMLAPLYGKKFDHLSKEMKSLITTKFEPKVFSVLSYGTVGDVTQKLFIILERKKSSSSGNDATVEFSAKKFYWL